MDDLDFPRAIIERIVKRKLAHVQGLSMQKEVKIAFSKSAAMFVLYLTSAALDKAKEGKRSTITADDVLSALKDLDMGELEPELEATLQEFRAQTATKKASKAESSGKKKEGDSKATSSAPEDGDGEDAMADD